MVDRHYRRAGWKSAPQLYAETIRAHVGKGSIVLDVGCGHDFPMAQMLKELGAEVHGIDPLAVDEPSVPGATMISATAEDIPYQDSTFNIVLSRSVFEHLKTPDAAFVEIGRVLKPGGRLVFLTPNKYDYVSLLARVVPFSLHAVILRSLEGRKEEDAFPVYYRANSRSRIAALAARAGLAVERLDYVNHYPYLLTFSPFLCRMGIAYDEFIRKHRGLHWLQAWLLGVLQNTKKATKSLSTE